MSYDVFISYSRKDSEVADRIAQAFETAGISYFIDRQGISGGMEFTEVLANAILESKIFLFLASENSYNSKFTQSEVGYAFKYKQKEDIIPYFIDNSTLPKGLDFTLASINWRNMSQHPIETIVADIRLKIGPKSVGQEGTDNMPSPCFLKLKSDIDCRFYLDGEEYMLLKQGELKKIPLAQGEYELRFVSTENPADNMEMDFVMPGNDKILKISLGAIRDKRLSEEKESMRQQEKARRKADAKQAEIERRTCLIAQGWVDLGLPSGTLWKDKNEEGLYTFDEAMTKYGSNLPTKEQLEELINSCRWTWQDGGYKVVGPNGNSILLSATGWRRREGSVYSVGSFGVYWSSTIISLTIVWGLTLKFGKVNMCHMDQYSGQSVILVQNL